MNFIVIFYSDLICYRTGKVKQHSLCLMIQLVIGVIMTIVITSIRVRVGVVSAEVQNGYLAHTLSRHILPAFVKLGLD